MHYQRLRLFYGALPLLTTASCMLTTTTYELEPAVPSGLVVRDTYAHFIEVPYYDLRSKCPKGAKTVEANYTVGSAFTPVMHPLHLKIVCAGGRSS